VNGQTFLPSLQNDQGKSIHAHSNSIGSAIARPDLPNAKGFMLPGH
jgi:hypothetical protein